jgi:energy-coupling factor transport system permease protein
VSAPAGLNPLAKMMMLIWFSVAVLLMTDPVLVLASATVVIALTRVYSVRSLVTKGITWFALAIFVAQVLFNRSGDLLFGMSVLEVHTGGILSGVTIAGRFLALVGMSWLFVGTTKASHLSSALASAGMPYRYATLPALAMRFVPTFQFELAVVREAQATRGLRLDKSLAGLIRSVRHTMGPMLLSAMSKVNSLAASMTGRGFGAYPTRTMLEPHEMTRWDAAAIMASVGLGVVLVLLDWQACVDTLVIP